MPGGWFREGGDQRDGTCSKNDRENSVAVDLAEQTAGKTALQQAGEVIVIRVLPKLLK